MYTKITYITYVDNVITLFNKRDQDLAYKVIPDLMEKDKEKLFSEFLGKTLDEVDLTGWTVI